MHRADELFRLISDAAPRGIFVVDGERFNVYDVARRIRSEPWGRNILPVALTGWGQDDDKRRALDVGFNRHLVKPVQPMHLESALQSFA